jgi:hypothetical protein
MSHYLSLINPHARTIYPGGLPMNSFLKTIGHELGQIANALDTNGWIAVACVTFVAGYFFLKGNAIRST